MRATPRSARRSTGSAEWRRLARAALAEDRVDRDVTSASVVPAGARASARITAQAPGVVSGVAFAATVAEVAGLSARTRVADGDRVRAGTLVLELRGPARALLGAERTILNAVMHLSGIATATAATRRAVGSAGPEVWGTRKTHLGLRDLEKDAIRHGGGRPHRRDLSDGILVKTNHLALVPLPVAVGRAKSRARGRRVQVEVRSLADAVAALDAGADSLLIDNASPAEATRIVRGLTRAGRRRGVHIELSGGITPANAAAYRRTGADAISLGALTHSAPALPFHLTVVPRRR
ncbi:MAG: carboxylating nicotinate-nucleotide diphosphorylase [Thermoplasmata archaeon]|nr:carboxylating nicotinate-nucleotide diphosphorylase [Thermoplasmata archaeon]